MKKLLTVAVCGLLAASLATPVFADHTIGGYYRVQGYIRSVGLFDDDHDPQKLVDQRFRAKWTNNLNEYVSVVWYGEVDMPWGQSSKGAIGGGGKVGADGVNIETKNAYADVKIPETPVALRIGMQGVGDHFDGVVFNEDMAGVKIDAKLDMVNVSGLWSKWQEGVDTDEDDQDMWALMAGFSPMDGTNVGVDIYYNNDQAGDMTNWYLGLYGDTKAGPAGISGWLLYNGGTDESGAKDTDVSAWAATLAAKMAVGKAKVGGRIIYFSSDDDADDDLSLNGGAGAFEFPMEGLQIFLDDVYYNNAGRGARAITDSVNAGYGLLAFVVNGSMNLPMNEAIYVKGAAGYFMALTDEANDSGVEREGTNLGFELSAQAGIKVAKAADFSLRGAYAMLGDFYDKTVAGDDPEDMYQLVLMLNIGY